MAKKKRGPGQPTRLTRQRHDKIVDIIKEGNYENIAWMKSAISEQTYFNWKGRGEEALALRNSGKRVPDGELIYLEFFEDVKEAIATAEEYAVSKVRVHMDDSWQAAMTFLERKYPERWGKKDRLTIEAHIMAGDVFREIAAAIDERAPEIKEKFDAVMEWMASNK
jgi:hypothetical protein